MKQILSLDNTYKLLHTFYTTVGGVLKGQRHFRTTVYFLMLTLSALYSSQSTLSRCCAPWPRHFTPSTHRRVMDQTMLQHPAASLLHSASPMVTTKMLYPDTSFMSWRWHPTPLLHFHLTSAPLLFVSGK